MNATMRWNVESTTHDERFCGECEQAVRDAMLIATATGSVGATATREHHDDLHEAIVNRMQHSCATCGEPIANTFDGGWVHHPDADAAIVANCADARGDDPILPYLAEDDRPMPTHDDGTPRATTSGDVTAWLRSRQATR